MIKEISVSLNLAKKSGNLVAAVADATLDLADAGSIKMCGFRVMLPDGKPPWVAPPARKGDQTWFDVVHLKGAVKKRVDAAVLQKYDELTKASSRA
ncbi:MAG TPA: hypothetical protein VGW33_08960 [Terriglobia bacterium]|nr:hypothetical protein [Terriglobia bacterium]